MANDDTPFGLKPVGFIFPPNKYILTANYATAMGIGDPVVGVAAGTVNQATAGTGSAVLGAAAGFQNASGEAVAYFPASSTGTWYIWVYDNPLQEFMIQDDGTVTQIAATDVFNSGNLITTHAASSVTGISGFELNSSDAGAAFAAGDQLRIWGLVDMPGNAVGANAKWRVTIDNHMKLPNIVGVGV